MDSTTTQGPREGDHYIGWGRTWRVVRVWDNGAVDIVDVDAEHRTLRLPMAQFKDMPRADASARA